MIRFHWVPWGSFPLVPLVDIRFIGVILGVNRHVLSFYEVLLGSVTFYEVLWCSLNFFEVLRGSLGFYEVL